MHACSTRSTCRKPSYYSKAHVGQPGVSVGLFRDSCGLCCKTGSIQAVPSQTVPKLRSGEAMSTTAKTSRVPGRMLNAQDVNLIKNPERNTGYNGSHIWQARGRSKFFRPGGSAKPCGDMSCSQYYG